MTSHIFRLPASNLSCATNLARVLPFLLFLVLASPAQSAINVTAEATVSSGASLDAVRPGDLVSIDITVRSDGAPTHGVELSAHSYDSNIVSYRSAELSPTLINQVCLPAIGCIGGWNNFKLVVPPAELATPSGSYVQYYLGGDFPRTVEATGELDEGVITGIAGDPQFRVVFEALQLGTTTLDFNGNFDAGNYVVVPIGSDFGVGVLTGNSITITVIPEPGTALLMGLGLAALARKPCEKNVAFRSRRANALGPAASVVRV